MTELPVIAKRQLGWFARYVRWYLRRNFHALHLLCLAGLDTVRDTPLLICLNHPSWWDPLVGLHLSQTLFPARYHAAPIAADGLAKYQFFSRLGFFGVQKSTVAGARRFLEIGSAVLARNDGALWVTAQGAFTDIRQPVHLESGVGHLAQSAHRFAMLPVALEYSFWDERYPEAFACIGRALLCSGRERTAAEWNGIFERALQHTLDELSRCVIQRNAGLFEPLMRGSAGIGGIYDAWRATKSRLGGKRFEPQHGNR